MSSLSAMEKLHERNMIIIISILPVQWSSYDTGCCTPHQVSTPRTIIPGVYREKQSHAVQLVMETTYHIWRQLMRVGRYG